jgi:peptidoglycan hydrolase CwlO-like protein
MKKWIIYLIALAVIVGACFYIYKTIFPPEPTQIVVTDQALDAAKQENADMRRRLDELEKQVRQGAKQIKQEERAKVDSLPPDAVADSIVSELRLFLGSD